MDARELVTVFIAESKVVNDAWAKPAEVKSTPTDAVAAVFPTADAILMFVNPAVPASVIPELLVVDKVRVEVYVPLVMPDAVAPTDVPPTSMFLPSAAVSEILDVLTSKVAVTPVEELFALIAAAICADIDTVVWLALSMAPISTPLIRISLAVTDAAVDAVAAPVVVVELTEAITPVELLMALIAFAFAIPLEAAEVVGETPSLTLAPT